MGTDPYLSGKSRAEMRRRAYLNSDEFTLFIKRSKTNQVSILLQLTRIKLVTRRCKTIEGEGEGDDIIL